RRFATFAQATSSTMTATPMTHATILESALASGPRERSTLPAMLRGCRLYTHAGAPAREHLEPVPTIVLVVVVTPAVSESRDGYECHRRCFVRDADESIGSYADDRVRQVADLKPLPECGAATRVSRLPVAV